MGSPIVWFEVLGQDSDKLRSFYGDIFDWKFQMAEGMDYGMTDAGGEGNGVGGGIGHGEGGVNWAIFYVQVPDINATIKEIEEKGGQVIVPRTVIPDMVTFAVFADTEGNKVGLVEAMEE